MNQYQKTTEKKKQAIIQAALHLFKEKGFKETSIKSIAEVAKVSPVSIFFASFHRVPILNFEEKEYGA